MASVKSIRKVDRMVGVILFEDADGTLREAGTFKNAVLTDNSQPLQVPHSDDMESDQLNGAMDWELQLELASLNDYFLAGMYGATRTATGSRHLVMAEAATVPATPFQVTLDNATGVEIISVRNADDSVEYEVLDSEGTAVAGESCVFDGTDTLEFASGDEAESILVRYLYTDSSSGVRVTMPSAPTRPRFRMVSSGQVLDSKRSGGKVSDVVVNMAKVERKSGFRWGGNAQELVGTQFTFKVVNETDGDLVFDFGRTTAAAS